MSAFSDFIVNQSVKSQEQMSISQSTIDQLRAENERLTRECQKLVGFKVEAPRLLDEIERLKAKLDKWKEQCRLLTVRLNDGDKAFQNSQAEIERLKGEVERWKESAISDDEEFKKTIVDLAHHKQLLVERDRVLGVAREIIRDAQMNIEADNIDWARFQEGPDHDPNYKPEFPEIVTRCADAVSQINKVLEVPK